MKKVFLDINFVCDLLISRKTSESSRKEFEKLIDKDIETLVLTSSLPTIYYIISNMHKVNLFSINQMKSIRDKALDFKDKISNDNALEIANFFINEALEKPDIKIYKIKAIEVLNDLCNDVVKLVPTTTKATNQALQYCKKNPKEDFEDVLQYFSAKENECDAIYTNDKKFPKLSITLKRTDKNISDFFPA